MSYKPRWFWRIKAFNRIYNRYCDSLSEYKKGKLQSFQEVRQTFDSLKSCYVLYYKSLMDIIKDHNIIEFLPLNILKNAQKLGLITNIEIWTDYIDDLNEYCQTNKLEEVFNFTKYIIEKYQNAPQIAKQDLDSFISQHDIQDDEVFQEFDRSGTPKYTPEEIGITERSYNLILNCLKANNYIEYAWLHGSRTTGKNRKSSDIDLIIDLPQDKEDDLKEAFRQLYIPYRLEFVNTIPTDNEYETGFLRASSVNAKLIYKKTDFE